MMQMRSEDISAIAKVQLLQWTRFALKWVLRPEYREGQQLHLICGGLGNHETDIMPLGPCGQSIYSIYDGGNFRMIQLSAIVSLIVAHIRNVHREMEDLVYSER